MVDLGDTSTSIVVIDNYTVGQYIGKGAFGKVYKAQHNHLDRKACIKISPSKSEELYRYLEKEAKILNALDHEHIVRLYDLTIYEGQPCLIMEFIDGGDLSALLKSKSGPLPLEEVDSIIGQIVKGLNYAHHEKRVIHLDLKPSNILRNKEGKIFIADFGIAKIRESDLSQTLGSSNAGTPAYMAPEHHAGKPEYRSDLYSLGVITYQLLTGRLPFTGNPFQMRDAHCHKPPPSLQTINTDIPEEIEQIVLKMLAKKPEERYQSALDFSRDLHSAFVKSTIQIRMNPSNIIGLLPLIPDDQIASLEAGDYRGPFIINKRLRLIGSGKSTRLYTIDEPVLHISVPGVQLENMVIERTHGSSDEDVIETKEHSYEVKNVTILGGTTEKARWEDAEWLLPVDGFDFGRIPVETEQKREIQLEVKERCAIRTDVQGLRVFPTRFSPGPHVLYLTLNTSGRPPGTHLDGTISLQSETETDPRVIQIHGQIEQPSLTLSPEEQPALLEREWPFQITQTAASNLLRKLGSDEEKRLVKGPSGSQRELRREIVERGYRLLNSLIGLKASYWYVRRFKIDEEDQDAEVWELTQATDRSTALTELTEKRETLRLIGSIHREGLGPFRINKITFPQADRGVKNLVSLPALIRLARQVSGYTGIDKNFITQIQKVRLFSENAGEVDVDQLQDWEELLEFRKTLVKKSQYWVKYSRHTYRDGHRKVTFYLDKEEARDGQGELLAYDMFQERVRHSKRESLRLFTTLPGTFTTTGKRGGKEIGTLERFRAEDNSIIISLEPKIAAHIDSGNYDLPKEGYLHFDAYGDMQQIIRQQEAITDLKEGKAQNRLLADFFFDPRKARLPVTTTRLQPADLLSSDTCNSGQIAVIEQALTIPDILLIQGPPGTGKTTVIAEICYQIARRGGRTLVASQSNLAVDNALSRIIHHPSVRALRKGTPDTVEDEGREFMEQMVVQTWLNKTADDCQKKLQQRQKNIALFKSLQGDITRFSQYRQSEIRLSTDEVSLQYKLADLNSQISNLQMQLSQNIKAQVTYAPIEQFLTTFLAGKTEWERPDIEKIRTDVYQYHMEAGDRQQFLKQINTCGQLMYQAGLPPLAARHLLRTLSELKEALPTWSRAWEEIRRLNSRIEKKIDVLTATNQQKEQLEENIRDKENQLSEMNSQMNLVTHKQSNAMKALQEITAALNTLPQDNGVEIIASCILEFISKELSRQLAAPGPMPSLELAILFPPSIIAAIQQDTLFLLAVWHPAERTIQRKIQQLVDQINMYEQHKRRLARCYQLFELEWHSLPEITQQLEQRVPVQPLSIPKDNAGFDQLITKIEHNLRDINKIRTRLQGIINMWLLDKRQLQDLLRETHYMLHIASEGQNRIPSLIQEGNRYFTANIASEVASKLRQLLIRQQQEVNTAYDTAIHQKEERREERRKLLDDLEQEQDRLSRLRIDHHEQTRQSAAFFDELSKCANMPADLHQRATENARSEASSSMLLQNYRAAYQRWTSDVEQLETLVNGLCRDIKTTHTRVQKQIDTLPAIIEQQKQYLDQLRTQAGELETDLQHRQSHLLAERQWWSDRWQEIPDNIRPKAPPEGLFSLPFLEVVQRQFTAWELELAKEEQFSERYDQLITDWITALQSPSEQDREEIQRAYLRNANVVGITCGQASKLSFQDYRAFEKFDVVIIDEVSKATAPELLLPALKGKRLILIGDQHQLPPMDGDKTLDQMAEESGRDPMALRYLNESYFKQHYQKAPAELKRMLSIQYRMHPDIMAAINQFYEQPLQCGLHQPDLERDHHLASSLIGPDKHLIWLTTPQVTSLSQKRKSQQITVRHRISRREVFNYTSSYSSFGEEPVGTSFRNRREAELIEKICEELQKIWAPKYAAGDKPKEIGVITFYAAQDKILRETLKVGKGGKSSRFPALNIRPGTVDRFQGMERPIIIVSMVRNNKNDIGFAKRDERINVAFSRAQQLLIIVGCHDLFCDSTGKAADRYRNVSNVVSHRGDFIDVF